MFKEQLFDHVILYMIPFHASLWFFTLTKFQSDVVIFKGSSFLGDAAML